MVSFWLLTGSMSHFLLDFFQKTIEGPGLQQIHYGGYQWLFPLIDLDYQFGLFWPEEWFFALVILIPISLLIWLKKRENLFSS